MVGSSLQKLELFRCFRGKLRSKLRNNSDWLEYGHVNAGSWRVPSSIKRGSKDKVVERLTREVLFRRKDVVGAGAQR